jgi:hypothetical protein
MLPWQRWMKPWRWTPRKILWISLTLLSLTQSARAEDACRGEADGRVSCSGEGFKILTGLVIQHRARADKCELNLGDAVKTQQETDGLLSQCQTSLTTIPPCPPPKSPAMALLGLGAGVLGSFLISGAFVAPVPDSARFPVALVGMGLIGGGIVLVWP